MIEPEPSITRTRWLACAWLVLVLAMLGHNAWLWTGARLQLDTDVLAMLPRDERDATVQNVTRQLTDSASRRVVVLVGGSDWPSARRAADAYAETLSEPGIVQSVRYRVDDAMAAQMIEFFKPWRDHLLTAQQRQMLVTQSPDQMASRAVEALYRPMGMPRVGEWSEDPLNLFGTWLATRAGESRVRVTDGRLSLSDGDRHYALLTLEQQGSAFSMAAQEALLPVLARAKQQANSAVPEAEVLAIGVPLYAAAAAAQGQHEMHTIGAGSLLGIVLLTLFAFSAIRPRLLVTLSIAVGLLAAVSVCALLFERLHLITLVFGASLVGVAENYGTNYFSNRLGRAPSERWSMLREQAPVMWLAMLTTAIGYALLALTPFPGLRQIAVFSAVGLLAAFITVLWWFPFLDGGTMGTTRLALWIGSRRALWPTLGRNRFTLVFSVLAVALLAWGISVMRVNDDIRLLQNAPPELISQQIRIGKLLQLPSPGQFYLVQGSSAEEVLTREEALKLRLDALQSVGGLSGYQAITDWVPSARQQEADAAVIQRVVHGEAGVKALAMAKLGEPLPQTVTAVAAEPLQVDAWLSSPVSEPFRQQWLGRFADGYASIVLLRGVDGADKLERAAGVAPMVPGVRWVDTVAQVSGVMARYRYRMGGVIAASYCLVFAALAWRYGRRAWRALVPTALASCLTLSLLALLGQPLQLFNVLALLLILGMGVDYGIFLLEQPDRDAIRPFLSVTLAAASTLLAFGLLALSATPALRAFGLTMLFGIGLSWLLTPLFLPSTIKPIQKVN
ncbi:MAG: MMPL family transporter [Pseudomonadota bacterium]